jgi:hypothetical protein
MERAAATAGTHAISGGSDSALCSSLKKQVLSGIEQIDAVKHDSFFHPQNSRLCSVRYLNESRNVPQVDH